MAQPLVSANIMFAERLAGMSPHEQIGADAPETVWLKMAQYGVRVSHPSRAAATLTSDYQRHPPRHCAALWRPLDSRRVRRRVERRRRWRRRQGSRLEPLLHAEERREEGTILQHACPFPPCRSQSTSATFTEYCICSTLCIRHRCIRRIQRNQPLGNALRGHLAIKLQGS